MAKTKLNLEKPTPTSNTSTGEESNEVFQKMNYVLMLAGIGLIVLGFVIMSMETAENGIGFLGLTLGPIVAMAGFVLEVFAIMHKSKK
jgi:hypothetical protein